jgi:hypothetical protein
MAYMPITWSDADNLAPAQLLLQAQLVASVEAACT